MKEVINFYAKNQTGALATIDNGKPRVRPFQYQCESGGKLYFCTANDKDVYKQLAANPDIEFTSTSPDYLTMRVSGPVKFSKDMKIKKQILDANELVRSIYLTPENPKFEVFYLEHGSVKVADLSGKPPKFVKF
ncbi:MAG TPA: pyridoxamine 5'-phosphate oxidase family protein [Methanocorpusculum sp.]|nr:pyridoxamine 5'-phosphate oxidase family protein [Methanocorpusculum sp.]